MAETPARTSSNKKYYSIFQGKFARKVEKGTEGAVTRMTKPVTGTPKEVYELYFDDIGGKIINIEIETTDKMGKQYKVTLYDVGEELVVTMPVKSGFGDKLMDKILNVNLKEDVKIVAYDFVAKDTGKKRQGINIFQGSEFKDKIDTFFSKENPKGRPQKTDDIDWEEYNILLRKFYAKVLEQKVQPAIIEANKPAPPPVQTNDVTASETDDLPFIMLLPLGLGLLANCIA